MNDAGLGGIGPHVKGGVVARHDITQHPSVEARAIGNLALADEAEAPADRDAAFLSEARIIHVDAFPPLPWPKRTES